MSVTNGLSVTMQERICSSSEATPEPSPKSQKCGAGQKGFQAAIGCGAETVENGRACSTTKEQRSSPSLGTEASDDRKPQE